MYSDNLYIYKEFLYSYDHEFYCNCTQICASYWRNSL